MLNLWIFFYGAVPEEQELQQMEGFGKFCTYFLVSLGSLDPREHGDPVTAALEPAQSPELGMLQGTGYTEMWDDAESSW